MSEKVSESELPPSAASPAASSPSPSPSPSSEAEKEKKEEKEDEEPVLLDSQEKKPDGIKSTYYHFKSTPKEEAAKYAPKLIDPSSLPAKAAPSQGSTWNAAGTWEERDLSSVAQQKLKESLLALPLPLHEDGEVKVAAVSKVKGESSVVFSRGKKRLGYDLSATVEWEGQWKGQKAKGTIEIHGIEDTNSEDEYVIKYRLGEGNEDASAAEKLLTLMKKSQNNVRKQIVKFLEELKEQ